MAWLLLLTLPGAEWLLRRSVPWWVAMDLKAMAKDGSKDTLKDKFHGKRLAQRAGTYTVLAMVAALPLVLEPWSYGLLVAGVLTRCGSYFLAEFNPRLSMARKLPRYYVSSATKAARFPDRYLWQKAMAAIPMDDDPARVYTIRQGYAGVLLAQLLRRVLLFGAMVAGVLVLSSIAVWLSV